MDNDQRDLLARLNELQAPPDKKPEPGVDDFQARLDRLQGRDSSKSPPADDDIYARLNRLQGRDPSSSGNGLSSAAAAASKPFPIQKKLTEQEEIDLLLNQVNDEAAFSIADEANFQSDLATMEQQFQALTGSSQPKPSNLSQNSSNSLPPARPNAAAQQSQPSNSPGMPQAGPQAAYASTSPPKPMSHDDEVAALLAQLASEPATSSSDANAIDNDSDDETQRNEKEVSNIVKYAEDLSALDIDLNDPSSLTPEKIAKISSIKAPKSVTDESKRKSQRKGKWKLKKKRRSGDDSGSSSDLSDSDTDVSNSDSDSDSEYRRMKKKKAEMDKKTKKKWFRF